MPTYVWKGKNRYGDTVGGERVAASKEELGRMLQKDQITVLSIGAAKGGFSIPFLKREKVRMKDLAVYSRQLSVLIDAELPLIQSLGILEEQQKNTYFKNVIKTVKDDVEAGSTLNQAKRKHPKAFDDLYCNLIASGEQSGSLDIMLRRLSEFIEKNVKLRSKVKQAMIYPVGILIFAIVVTIFMLWKVIPVFATIFRDLGAELPWLTAMIVALSDFVQKYIFLIFAGMIALFFAFRYYRKHQAGTLGDRQAPPEDAPVRQPPLQGGHDPGHPDARDPYLRRRAHARSHEDHFDDGRATSSSRSQLVEARKQVSEGKTMAESFKQAGKFPTMMLQMINVGEATGTLDEMLNKLANFYDEEVDVTVASLLSILEPIMLIFIGGLVGGLVVSMYLPIFSLMQQF